MIDRFHIASQIRAALRRMSFTRAWLSVAAAAVTVACLTSNAQGQCAGDRNGDHQVNGMDLAVLLTQWGTNGTADIDNSGVVNGTDLALLLGQWGMCSNGNLTNTTLSITQTWAQQPTGFVRTAAVLVPAGTGPFPVVIMLHGNGGNSSFINSMGTTLNSAIRVAPNGYLTSWNVDSEVSKAPDVAFIRDLIALLKTYDNVDAGRISIYGSSNGAGMTNRLLIELDGTTFQRAACRVSQMITKMHHDGSFWFNASGNNTYDEQITPANARRVISISGTADPIVPYTGGSGVGTTFMHCQESIYRFAQAMGETGPQLTDAAGVPGNGANGYSAPFVKYSYRNGQVVHYKLVGGNHGLVVNGSNAYATEANQLIASFLLQ
jgi:poly(3-hydroxybutyrate) depolymerase